MNDKRKEGMMIVEPADFKSEKLVPYHGTIFTAKLPDVSGGIHSSLSLHVCEHPFGNYHGTTLLSRSPFFEKKGPRKIKPGGYGRFLVDDSTLGTGHDITERNWFGAIFLRPLFFRQSSVTDRSGKSSRQFIAEDSDQIVVEPQDTRFMIDSALSRTIDDVTAYRSAVYNDLTYFAHLSHDSADALQEFYESLRH